MTRKRPIYLITAENHSYPRDLTVISAHCSKEEADDIAAMIEKCSPSRTVAVLPIDLRGDFPTPEKVAGAIDPRPGPYFPPNMRFGLPAAPDTDIQHHSV